MREDRTRQDNADDAVNEAGADDAPAGPVSAHTALHTAIARLILERQHAGAGPTLETLARALLHPDDDPHTIWVKRGPVDPTEFLDIEQDLRDDHHDIDPTVADHRTTGRSSGDDQSDDRGDDSAGDDDLADVLITANADEPDRDSFHSDSIDDRWNSRAGQETVAQSGVDVLRRGKERGRYVIGKELGSGGVGRVVRAFDRDLGRVVAMKLPTRWPLEDRDLRQFVAEARATSALEHPNIVPIYDVGILSTGEIFYTMKRVRGRSLRTVLQELKQQEQAQGPLGDEPAHPVNHLLQVFVQVCRAIEYAHARGIIHRDIKPDNIMLGDYGEVHVMDWGLARRVEARLDQTNRRRNEPTPDSPGRPTVNIDTAGTPAYMSPEQATGSGTDLDERSDVYALSVVLYELLTLRQPSARPTIMETLLAVVGDPILPPSKVTPDREIAVDLDALVMRGLEKQRERRYQTVAELREAVQRFLDGHREHAADRLCAEGDRLMRVYERAWSEYERVEQERRAVRPEVHSWDPPETKSTLWKIEDRVRSAEQYLARVYERATRQYNEALARHPRHGRALAGLARMYWHRYQYAEQIHDHVGITYFRALIRLHDETGQYVRQLEQPGTLLVESTPPGAAVFLHRLADSERRLQVHDSRFIGHTPLSLSDVEHGSWLVSLKAPGHSVAWHPIHISRPGTHRIVVRLRNHDPRLDHLCFIPGGTSVVGGDKQALDPVAWRFVDVADFHIMRLPVTFADYAAFLESTSRDQRDALMPRDDDGAPLLLRVGDALVMSAQPGCQGTHDGPCEDAHWSYPVVGITYDAAVAYAAWRSDRDLLPYRLPTEAEWERAARGADGRHFPWGDQFDPAFCKMRDSRPGHFHPEPVGSFATDRSPFDVRDLAGGVRELVHVDDANDPWRITRGGSWCSHTDTCRLASRQRLAADGHAMDVGFRLVCDV